MPQVPTYDQPTQQRQTLRGGELSAPNDVGAFGGEQAKMLQGLGQGASQLAEGLDRVDARNDRMAADKTEEAILRDWTKFDMEARQKYQGERIGEYKTAAEDWWKNAKDTYGKDLSPRAQMMATKPLERAQTAAVGSTLSHYATVNKANQERAFDSKMSARIDWAIVNQGTAEAVNTVRQEIIDEVAAKAAADGLGTDSATKIASAYNSKLTTDYINKLLKSDPAGAEKYLQFAKDQGFLSADAYTAMADKVATVSAIAGGSATADKEWAAALPRKPDGSVDFNKPVDLYSLEQKVKEQFAGDPARQQHAISRLRETKASFDATQREYDAGNTNSVYDMLGAGTPMSKVRQSDAWRNLPGKTRDAIEAQQESRAFTRENRALTAANRGLVEAQKADRALMLTNADEYLRFTNPEALAKMTRAEVVASRALFGLDGAKHLLDRFDSLQTASGRMDAKMDKDDFNNIAISMGLDPTAKPGSAEGKRLGDLHFRTEQALLAEQRKLGPKGVLSREDKYNLVKQEVAKTVALKQTWLRGKDEVSVATLTADQLERVVVPDSAKAELSALLAKGNKADPSNPAYFPTEANMRKLYLRRLSPFGAVTPDATK